MHAGTRVCRHRLRNYWALFIWEGRTIRRLWNTFEKRLHSLARARMSHTKRCMSRMFWLEWGVLPNPCECLRRSRHRTALLERFE